MTLRQFGLILFIGLVFEVTAFAIYYDDLIYLRRPISELLIAGPQPFVRHATDALARPALTPAHVNTIAEVAHNFRLTELEIAALERRGTMSPFDRSARLRLAEALRERGDRPAEAAAAYLEATRMAGHDAGDRRGLAVALEAAGRHGEAVAAWTSVPEALRSERPEWVASRLRALAKAGPPEQAAPELQQWLKTHPDDREMRGLLVDVWTRAGRPDLALDAVGPLAAGSTRDAWGRREAELALAAGDHARAIERLDSLVQHQRSVSDDHWRLAELLVSLNRHDEARGVMARLASPAVGCSDRLFGLVDRLSEPIATDLLLALVPQQRCADTSRWSARAIDRAVAAERHAEALAALQRWPAAGALRSSRRRLEGQLLVWTGDPSKAIAVLTPWLLETPGDADARSALIDALRATGQADAAWATAEPLLRDGTPTPERLAALAETALDADHPDAVRPILARIPEAAVPAASQASLLGRLLLSEGRPADAQRTLQVISPQDLTPAAALALIDSTVVMEGWAAAAVIAEQFPAATPQWLDVLARRLTAAEIAGRHDDAARVRAALERLSPTSALLAEADALLISGRPHDALAVLSRAPASASAIRLDDVRATALAGVGNLAEAAALVATLQQRRPTFVTYIVRGAELHWRLHPAGEDRDRVLALPARFPGRADASIAAARVLASERRHTEALATLGDPSAWRTLPLDARVLAARSLRALDRASEALPLVDGLPLAGDAAILRAELVAAVKGPAEGAAAFRALTNDSRATADVFLAWASTSRTAPERLAILDDANHRFPGRADVLRSLARNSWLGGEMDGARAAASAAIAVAPRDDDAWFVLVDATAAARPRAELDEVLRRFDARIADSPALVIGMAERLAGLARTPDDPLLSQAFQWLDTVAVDEALIVPKELAQVRLLASAERWNAALDAVGAILQRQPAPLQALRLRAEVLSWAGRHVDALAAYDTYLRAAPNDIEARRQQARVAGWAGRYGQSRRLYGTLQSVVTDDATVSAEIAAKGAFFAGRWQDASRAYERWLALEPDNTEARFELAETLRAQGHARAADQMLLQLGSASGHRLAMAAYDRAVFNRRPSFAVIDRRRDASGYGGLRLLDLREHGGSVAVGFDAGDRTGLIVEGAALQAVAGPDRRSGSRALLAGTTRVSERWTLAARGEWWQLGGSDGSIAGVIQAAWRPADHWTLTAGTDRERIFDTLATVDRRLTASGVFAASERQSPQSSLQVRFGWQHLSDDNARHRTSVTATRTLGLRQVRAIVWIEGLGYRRTTTDYFSPSGFVRADAGVEYTHQFAKPRFQGDRRREIAGTYLIGTDDCGVRYQHPSLRLAFEAVRGLTFDMTAGAIRSSVYKDASFSISLRIGGAAPRR